ncbi:HEAT repeat protein [Teladorsagia circumcincta]|uniref:HEAT repeat protein n=1 Tax=Teladorsagia circumcincta TaxID=45464 RepID=A0A2G9V4V4_TELCI|nr:HEAT repeat protein [Teladorsagia circumcincta]
MIQVLVSNPVPGKPEFEELLDQLTAPVYDVPNLSRQAFQSISAATGVVAAASGDMEKARSLAEKLADQLQNETSTDAIRLFSVHALGELGRRCPKVYENSHLEPEKLIIPAFNSSSEDLKAAAAQALGALAVGNHARFLPFILNEIQTQPKRQYLLLHALKEVIGHESTNIVPIEVFRSRISEIWPVLVDHADGNEEGTRNVVAECLGKLSVIDPHGLLPELKSLVTSPSARVRSAAVTAVKFMISDEKRPVDAVLQQCIGEFLQTMTDSDLNVRRVALVVLNSAAHNKPSLIRNLLDVLLPSVYSETQVRKELIREVEMGPFKHQVDDGLDLRKSAFECMYTLLESCLEKLEIFEFINYVENGLRDMHHDIRLLSYLMLMKLAMLCPNQLVQRLDKICESLKTQLQTKPKSNAVKQEIDRQDELKRAVIRVVLALQHRFGPLPGTKLVLRSAVRRENSELDGLLFLGNPQHGSALLGDGVHSLVQPVSS